MVASQDDFIAAARACLGTRFRHQGRSARHGLDCVGLVVHAATACHIPVSDYTAYGRLASPGTFAAYLRGSGLLDVSGQAFQPGDIGVFDFGHGAQHVAILAARSMIHAYAPARKVIENRFNAPWPDQLIARMRFPALAASPSASQSID